METILFDATTHCKYGRFTGGLFDDQDGTGLTTKAWEHSVRRVNHNEILLPKYKLESIVERLPTNNSFYASDKGSNHVNHFIDSGSVRFMISFRRQFVSCFAAESWPSLGRNHGRHHHT